MVATSLFIVLLLTLAASSSGWGFFATFTSIRSRSSAPTRLEAARSSSPTSSRQRLVESLARGTSVAAAALASGALVLTSTPRPALAAKPASEDDYIESLAIMLLSKKILMPLDGFIKKQGYDAARTNVKYLLNQLQIEKAAQTLVRNSIEYSNADPDVIEAATDAGSSLGNSLIQLDSTIYTVIFIPSDDGLPPPAADKYLVMLSGYLKNVNSVFDLLISLGSEAQLLKANKRCDALLVDLPFKDALFNPKALANKK